MSPKTAILPLRDAKDSDTHVDERNLAAILDNLDAMIYVADMQTHELLYMNAYGRARWGPIAGKRCWEVLQSGQNGPCSFCTNPRLLKEDGTPTGVYVWEFQNTIDGRWYQCRDQAIRWSDGRLVRLEIATDITERKRMELQLEAATVRAEKLAYTDDLTGLANRRAFFEEGSLHFQRNRRKKRSSAVLAFDIDYFKSINDAHGHAIGDRVLQVVAKTVSGLLRETDICARLGGEEFAIVLPVESAADAVTKAEQLREAIAGIEIAEDAHRVQCTASFGVAFCDAATNATLEDLLARADDALFAAKRGGRNRVVCAD